MAFVFEIFLLISTLGFLSTGVECLDVIDKEWWETTSVYQIWPRGFQDSDGDGEGDLRGITSRLDYIKDLGIDTIWLNPIYSSPLVDAGYDISNYTDVNPLLGSFEQFDELVQEAHNRDLKVILDIVPNHSSDKHDWFQQSVNEVEPYNNYYIWANGSTDDMGNNIPPNNWVSTYSDEGGSAWTWHDTRKQWYYHKFHTSQPDLNLRNENVVQELLDVFDFWLKKDVDGFRINAVSYLFEEEHLLDEPSTGNESYTFGLPENTELLYTFRAYINKWVEANNVPSKLLIAEAYDSDDVLIKLYGNSTHEGIPPCNFRFITQIHNSTNAKRIKSILEQWFDKLPDNASTNWMLSNHDNSRAATRIGLNRVDGLHMLTLLLPGQAYTYYGDEIAMLDTKIQWHETIDPMGCTRTKETYEKFSRDPARTPMQWNSNTSAGFSTCNSTYLPIHPNYIERNVEDQQKRSPSNINTYKLLSFLRKQEVFTQGDYEFESLNDDRVLILKRFLKGYPIYIVVINLGILTETIDLGALYPNLKDTLEVVVTSSNAIRVPNTIARDKVVLTANAALVLQAEEIEEVTTEPSTTTTEEIAEPSSSTIGDTTIEESTTDETTTFTDETIETSTVVSSTTPKENSAVTNTVSVLELILYTTFTVIILFKF